MKRLVALLMALAVSIGLVGCVPKTPPQGDGDDVVIKISIVDNGYGMQWLNETKARFEAEFEEKQYADGKYTGVFLQVNETGKLEAVKDFGNSANHIVFGGGLVKEEANYGTLLNLTADEEGEYGLNIYEKSPYEYTGINSEIESVYDLIKDTNRSNYVANDGEIYGLPTYEVFAGASYDKDLFDRYGFYFAYHDLDTLEEQEGKNISTVELECPLLLADETQQAQGYTNMVYQLVNVKKDTNWENHRSVGPDGVRGTLDDGLPSSLLELIALCWYMNDEYDVSPLQIQGELIKDYGDTFLHGLVVSLLGDNADVIRNFEGQVEAVVGFTGHQNNDPEDPRMNLAANINYIRQPKTEMLTITEETGFYTQWSVERYYAMALYEIFLKNDWFADGSDPVSGKINHIESENNFVFSDYNDPSTGGTGDRIAFLSESSYWYNEATIRGPLPNFYLYNDEVEDRGVRWYSYPVNIANSVTGETKTGTVNGITESLKGERNVIAQSKLNQIVFNKVAISKNKDGAVLEALKDFINFWYSEDELTATTISQGMGRNMNFVLEEADKTEWAGFYRHLNDLKDQSYVLPMAADNDTFSLGCRSEFKLGEGGQYFSKYAYNLWVNEKTAAECFLELMWTPSVWKGKYFGSANKDTIDYLKDGSGNPIVYVNPWDGVVQ